MANIRLRKDTGKLYIDFHIKGVRFREYTSLTDSVPNRKKLERLAQKIEASLVLGDFRYEDYFPSSSNIKRAAKIGMIGVESKQAIETELLAMKENDSTPKFKEFVEQWYLEKTIEWRKSHLRSVRSMLDRTFIPYFGKYSLGSIKREHLLTLRVKIAQQPGRGGNVTMSPKSVNNIMGVLRMILEEASLRYSIENPYQHIKPLKLQRKHIEPFSLTEVNTIINKVREDYRNYYIVRFFTGMRTGEIDGLKWEFVDFQRKQIVIRETLIQGETEYTKTDGSQREIPMLGPVYEALMDQYHATKRLSPYVFCNTQGKPLEHNNVTKRVWYPLLEYLGLTKRRPYQTRHTAATLLLASGENPEWVARVLGHASTEMLFKVYSRYVPNATRQDGSAFDRLLEQQAVKAKEEK